MAQQQTNRYPPSPEHLQAQLALPDAQDQEADVVIAPQYGRRSKLVRDQRAERQHLRDSAKRSACDHDFQQPSAAAHSVCSKCGERRILK